MFSPNKNRPQLPQQPEKKTKPLSSYMKKRLWTTIALTFIFLEGIAATVPLLMQRPLLYAGEFFRKKEDNAP